MTKGNVIADEEGESGAPGPSRRRGRGDRHEVTEGPRTIVAFVVKELVAPFLPDAPAELKEEENEGDTEIQAGGVPKPGGGRDRDEMGSLGFPSFFSMSFPPLASRQASQRYGVRLPRPGPPR